MKKLLLCSFVFIILGFLILIFPDVNNILHLNQAEAEEKEFINLTKSKEEKDIKDIDFITFSITPKPNSKNPGVLRQKEIIESFLSENSPAYRKRRSREATKNSYHKSILTYFVLLIHNANK